MTTRGDSQRNTGEPCTCPHIKKSSLRSLIDIRQQNKGVKDMENHRIIKIKDTGEIHRLVCLDNQIKMTQTKGKLVIGDIQLVFLTILLKLLQVSSSLVIGDMDHATIPFYDRNQ